MLLLEIIHTCIAAQQRLIGKVVHKVLQGCKLIKPKNIAVVLAFHMKMLDRILCPTCKKMANAHYIEHTIILVRRGTSVSLESSPGIFLLVRAESSDMSDKMADELTINELID